MTQTIANVNWYGSMKSVEQSTGSSKTATYTGSASGSGIDYILAVTVANNVASENATAISLSYYVDGYDTTHSITYNTVTENYQSIEIDGVTRNYVLININSNDISNIQNVLLCFPGGGESDSTFIDYTSFNYIGSPVIVFLGQSSENTYTFQNAFPWLYNNFNQNGVTLSYQNDVKFVDTVLLNLFGSNTPELFLTGKSDGGGFCILYSNISNYKLNIKAIGICSSAHYGLNSAENIGSFDINNCFIGNNNTIIPYNIILPPNISIFIIHGTGDIVMPYYGQHCVEQNFNRAITPTSLWQVIDPTLEVNNGVITNNTFTVSFPSYIQEIINNNNLTQSYGSTTPTYSYSGYSSNNNNVLNFITIYNQNHDWSGHYDSGPDSNQPANFTMDATYLMIKFFNLEIGSYIPTVQSIPCNLLTYKNEIIN